MSDEQNEPVRSRDRQIVGLGARIFVGMRNHTDSKCEAQRHIEEAEARGAEEQRRKDAEGQEPAGYASRGALEHLATRSAPRVQNLYGYSDNRWDIPLYTHPANVAALEARVKELEEAIEDYFSARAGCEVECVSRTGEPEQGAKREARNDLRIAFERKISAALKREGGE